MTEIQIQELLLKYKENQLSEEDLTLLLSLAQEYENDDHLAITEREFKQVEQQMSHHILHKTRKNKPIKLWTKLGATAAAILFIVSTGLFYYHFSKKDKDTLMANVYLNDVKPGRTGATLTLANGKKVILNEAANGEIVKEQGISILKTSDGQLIYEAKATDDAPGKVNTLTTAKGETYILILPDKSKVWLNAGSSLTYAVSFNSGKIRKVKLDGEAYFEVEKDKLHPFVVESQGQEVRVLGTHFNVNSYPDEPVVKTTLLAGSVIVKDGKMNKTLKPGQQAIKTHLGIDVKNVDLELATDWKEGGFSFKEGDFKTTMRKISRWYDVEIIYSDDLPADIELGGWIPRSYNVSSVLKLISSIGKVHFKVEGRRIWVSR